MMWADRVHHRHETERGHLLGHLLDRRGRHLGHHASSQY